MRFEHQENIRTQSGGAVSSRLPRGVSQHPHSVASTFSSFPRQTARHRRRRSRRHLPTTLACMLVLLLLLSPAAFAESRVERLLLVNADTNEMLFELTDGMQLNLALLPTRHLNVHAETAEDVSKVVFGLNTHERFREESAAPYALAGDDAGNYSSWTPRLGENVITAVPFVEADEGESLIVRFSVIDEAEGKQAIESDERAAAEDAAQTVTTSTPALVQDKDAVDTVAAQEDLKENGNASKKRKQGEGETVARLQSADPNSTGPSRRVLFTLGPTEAERMPPASGECLTILNQQSNELTVVCNHTLQRPTEAVLSKAATDEVICPLGAPGSPVVQTCPLDANQLQALQDGKLFVRIRSDEGALKGDVR
ncbi:MAG: hypothetical protein KDD69_03130 [Bdellovibrionales bacterium]|nr:hypothetical protein [Bdellovibrionales bacterium]